MHDDQCAGLGSIEMSSLVRYIRERIHRECDAAAILSSGDQAASVIRELTRVFLVERRTIMPAAIVEAVQEEVVASTLGHGPIERLLNDPNISEIMVNGAQSVWVERHGRIEQVDVAFDDDDHVIHVVDRMLAPVGRRINSLDAMVDARLPDGSRINAIIPPLAVDGPIVTIRKFLARARTLDDLERIGGCTIEQASVIRSLVRDRANIVVCGPTSSGKTTLVAAAMGTCQPHERIIVIEDAAELAIEHGHCLRLEARPSSTEMVGEVNVRDLVRNALRMRPDRIVVGEVRGAEAYDLIQALSTGHAGCWSTVHANGPEDALLRIESMALASGVGVPDQILRQQVARSTDVVIHVDRRPDGGRGVISISLVGQRGTQWSLEQISCSGVS